MYLCVILRGQISYSLHLIKVETISLILFLFWFLGHLGILGIWRWFDFLNLGGSLLFCSFCWLLSILLVGGGCRLLCCCGVILLHVFVVLGFIEILSRIVLHEDIFVCDVAWGILRVSLSARGIVVDVTLNPCFVIGIQCSHVVGNPVVLEVNPIVVVLLSISARVLQIFWFVGAFLILPIELIAVVGCTVVLEESPLSFLNLLCWKSQFFPVFFAVFLVLSLASTNLGFTKSLQHLTHNCFSLVFIHRLFEIALLQSIRWGLFLFF